MIFTAASVAVVAHYLLDLPWAVGFVLGAVVSPPDAVAPMAIAKRFPFPSRVLTILEGEGLVNDATALILFSFAIAAVIEGGQFLAGRGGGQFRRHRGGRNRLGPVRSAGARWLCAAGRMSRGWRSCWRC